MDTPFPDDLLNAFRTFSARLGTDPLLVQGAGGNTSLKNATHMLIKASGCLLAKAETDDIFVTVDLNFPHRLTAAANGSKNLRPSIETSMHAIMPWPVVAHVHSVNTIAYAIRQNAKQILAEKLTGLPWLFVPYAQPGVTLTQQIAAHLHPETRVIVLGNHGLVVAGANVADTAALLATVEERLRLPVRTALPAQLPALHALAAETDYRVPKDDILHSLGTNDVSFRLAAGGSLYPDHVVFLGPAVQTISAQTQLKEWLRRPQNKNLPPPVMLVVEGLGVLFHKNASAGAVAMAGCLAEVLRRCDGSTPLHYLTAADEQALLGWDAEKYRQSMNG